MAIKMRRSTKAVTPAAILISAGLSKPCFEVLSSVLMASVFAPMDGASDSELEDMGTHVLNRERLNAVRSKTKWSDDGESNENKERYPSYVSIYDEHKGDPRRTSFPENWMREQ
jgi:hypothetical protein